MTLFGALSSLDAVQRAVLFGWSGFVAAVTLTGVIAAVVKPSWWGRDGKLGWFEVGVVGGLGFLPLIVNTFGT